MSRYFEVSGLESLMAALDAVIREAYTENGMSDGELMIVTSHGTIRSGFYREVTTDILYRLANQTDLVFFSSPTIRFKFKRFAKATQEFSKTRAIEVSDINEVIDLYKPIILQLYVSEHL